MSDRWNLQAQRLESPLRNRRRSCGCEDWRFVGGEMWRPTVPIPVLTGLEAAGRRRHKPFTLKKAKLERRKSVQRGETGQAATGRLAEGTRAASAGSEPQRGAREEGCHPSGPCRRGRALYVKSCEVSGTASGFLFLVRMTRNFWPPSGCRAAKDPQTVTMDVGPGAPYRWPP